MTSSAHLRSSMSEPRHHPRPQLSLCGTIGNPVSIHRQKSCAGEQLTEQAVNFITTCSRFGSLDCNASLQILAEK